MIYILLFAPVIAGGGIKPRVSHWQASVLLLHAWPWFTRSREQLRNHQVIFFKVKVVGFENLLVLYVKET